jgi:hypothetical protein
MHKIRWSSFKRCKALLGSWPFSAETWLGIDVDKPGDIVASNS